MFAKISTIVALAAVVVAVPTNPQPPTINQCNVGSVSCCTSQQDNNASAKSFTGLLSLLNVVVQAVQVPVGVTCDPISVIGVGSGSACAAQPVCCSNNSFNGLVALGCTPINVQL